MVDRHAMWLEAVHGVLQSLDVAVVGRTTSPSEALRLVDAHRPDLLVTGIKMHPGEIDGLTFLRQARRTIPNVDAIVLSMYTEPERIEAAFEAGAFAYVVKTAHPDDLASVIRQTFTHSVYLAPPRRVAALALEAAAPAGDTPDLTRREREILRLLAEGHSNAQLAKLLWVTEQTIKFHLSNIYRKLGVSNRTEAARRAHTYGLLTAPAEPLAATA